MHLFVLVHFFSFFVGSVFFETPGKEIKRDGAMGEEGFEEADLKVPVFMNEGRMSSSRVWVCQSIFGQISLSPSQWMLTEATC